MRKILIDYYGLLTNEKKQAWDYILKKYPNRQYTVFNDLFKSSKQRNYLRSKGLYHQYDYILVVDSSNSYETESGSFGDCQWLINQVCDRQPYVLDIIDSHGSQAISIYDDFDWYTDDADRAKVALYAHGLGITFENKPFYRPETVLNELFAPSQTDRKTATKPHKFRASKSVVNDQEIQTALKLIEYCEQNGGIEAWLDYPYKLCKSCGKPFKAYEDESLCADCGGIEQNEMCIDRCNYDVVKGVYVPFTSDDYE